MYSSINDMEARKLQGQILCQRIKLPSDTNLLVPCGVEAVKTKEERYWVRRRQRLKLAADRVFILNRNDRFSHFETTTNKTNYIKIEMFLTIYFVSNNKIKLPPLPPPPSPMSLPSKLTNAYVQGVCSLNPHLRQSSKLKQNKSKNQKRQQTVYLCNSI